MLNTNRSVRALWEADRRTVLTYLERDAGATLSDDLFTERGVR